MKHVILSFALAVVLFSCSSSETAVITSPETTVEGEFLFEGPNTLQGTPSENMMDFLTEQTATKKENIKAVYLSAATIQIAPDSLQNDVESILVQWVSDNLELVSVATKSPFPSDALVDLEVKADQDILPYLKDETSTLVVDANLTNDMDYLSAIVQFNFKVEYNK